MTDIPTELRTMTACFNWSGEDPSKIRTLVTAADVIEAQQARIKVLEAAGQDYINTLKARIDTLERDCRSYKAMAADAIRRMDGKQDRIDELEAALKAREKKDD
tara:strand:+ start:876 stop:1187 length:312 start_codon:yes stop_codon:yes gene_type:complete